MVTRCLVMLTNIFRISSILFPFLLPLQSESEQHVPGFLSHCMTVVLGLNLLSCYNPLVDWELRSITFLTRSKSEQELSTSEGPLAREPIPPSQAFLPTLSQATSPTPSSTLSTILTPAISFVNDVAFTHACKLEDS